MDLLSHTAFAQGVRLTVMGTEFQEWLPLCTTLLCCYVCLSTNTASEIILTRAVSYVDINQKHGEAARELAKQALSVTCTGYSDRFHWKHVLQVLPNLMDNM